MDRITIINSGGGVAKTSTSVNLAACLAKSDRRVLVIDLDGQGTASDWLWHDAGDKQSLLLDVMLGEISQRRNSKYVLADTGYHSQFVSSLPSREASL